MHLSDPFSFAEPLLLDGIGIYFRGEFKSEEFLIEKLKILIVDIDNDRIIRGIFYDGETIENSGG